MTLKLVRCSVVIFFLLYLVAVIWPLATLVSAAEPMILGLPFSLAWAVAWILLGFMALLILDHFERREEESEDQTHDQDASR